MRVNRISDVIHIYYPLLHLSRIHSDSKYKFVDDQRTLNICHYRLGMLSMSTYP